MRILALCAEKKHRAVVHGVPSLTPHEPELDMIWLAMAALAAGLYTGNPILGVAVALAIAGLGSRGGPPIGSTKAGGGYELF